MTHIPYRGGSSDLGPARRKGGRVYGDRGPVANITAASCGGGRQSFQTLAGLRRPDDSGGAGLKGYEMVAVRRRGSEEPAARRQMKWHGELRPILKNPDFQKSLVAVGQEPAWQETPERFHDFLKVEATKWAQVVKDSGATIQ